MGKTELDMMIERAITSTTQQYLRIRLNRAAEKIDRADLSSVGKVLIELRDMVKGIGEEIDALIQQHDELEVIE